MGRGRARSLPGAAGTNGLCRQIPPGMFAEGIVPLGDVMQGRSAIGQPRAVRRSPTDGSARTEARHKAPASSCLGMGRKDSAVGAAALAPCWRTY